MGAEMDVATALPDHVPPELIETFDLWDDEEILADTFGALERLQQRTMSKGGIVYNPYLRTWWVGNYDLAREIYQSPEQFSSRIVGGGIQRPTMKSMSHNMPFRWIPLTLDPPEHEMFKRVLTPMFTPNEMKRYLPHIRDIVRNLLAGLAQKTEGDFASGLANPAPAFLFTQMFGLPAARGEEYMSWNHHFFHSTNLEERGEAARKIIEAMTELTQRCFDDPRDDVMSRVVQTTIDGHPISFNDALGIGFVLYIGSLDTTTSHLNLQFLHMATHPQDQQRVRADKSLVPGAVEECLRLYGMVNPGRTVSQDMHFHGVELREGDKIGWASSAAGRDPDEFPDPGTFDPQRRPNRHLAFGAGPHRCVGLHLARQVLRVAMEEVHDALPTYRLSETKPIEMQTGIAIGVNELPLVWDQAPTTVGS